MTWADLVIVLVVVLSAIISLWRGFVREFVSLLTWIAAFWVAMVYAQRIDSWFERFISAPSMRVVLAFFLLFVGTLLAGAMVNHFAGLAVQRTGLTGTDRGLGILFGTFRGVVIVAVAVLLAGLTSIPGDPWWQASSLLQWFEGVAMWMTGFLPPELAEHFSF